MAAQPPLKTTPLKDRHLRAGARLVAFAGWEMPVQYQGVLAEHRAVRTAAGLFDVSHMGEVEVSGKEAVGWLDSLTPNHVARLEVGQAHYSALLDEKAGILDDLLIYRLEADRFLLVINAANTTADLEWLGSHRRGGVEIENVTDATALLALQGPAAAKLLVQVMGPEVESLRPFRFRFLAWGGGEALISRTGYTGEDGFEIYLSPQPVGQLWDALLERGRDLGVSPVGLGARDTLRLEAGLCLHGQDIHAGTTPLEAGLGFIVKLDKGEFMGRHVLARQRQEGVTLRLCGFRLLERGIARHGHEVYVGDSHVGEVTSGTHSPTLGQSIGMAYLPWEATQPGQALAVQVRGSRLAGEVVPLPFYRRPRT